LGLDSQALRSLTFPEFKKKLSRGFTQQRANARAFAGLAYILIKVLGDKQVKDPEELMHYFLTPVPEDPNEPIRRRRKALQSIKAHEARFARRRSRSS
jgi:hypothetical protein